VTAAVPDPPPRRTPLVLVLCAWAIVAIPLSWGLYQSVMKSRPLFMGAAAPAAVTPAPAASAR
jgi:hypothetical protein